MTKPLGDTRLAEQPAASRMLASWTRSSQAASGAQPYLACILAAGKLSNVHIPSSAWAGTAISAAMSSVVDQKRIRMRTPFRKFVVNHFAGNHATRRLRHGIATSAAIPRGDHGRHAGA